ncbi:N-acetyl-gamma-glutamyl-phosphate reductase [[Clostridium] methylpentosum DSM 5476]|uniref:N-acetyl-gamma-glutamyl-phosphate reductase n=1 Tax=[Clostridium] methylpentosum DSM 5476 TaxID=537013 RepID=C0EIH3_9FIRM|nr:N-acetyl-gamma-glutamyl-phosphate reductase [[Clostridium] methylpentosum DSM 5476]
MMYSIKSTELRQGAIHLKKIQAGIIGATGYAGAELLRLLLTHPDVEVAAISSVSFEHQAMEAVYPNFASTCGLILCGEDEVIEKSDVVFASLPHGLSELIAEKCVGQGKYLIDLGADFRLEKPEDYQEWYQLSYQKPELHKLCAYVIPELHRSLAKGCKIIANPGCYPTSIGLGLAPILQSGKADPTTIIIDSKSGVTGAGRGLTLTSHYPECNEAFSPYKIAQHRHTPEIEQTLSAIAGTEVKVTFVPHLLPVNRGIVSTIYLSLTEMLTEEELHQMYEDFYQEEQFVRILPPGKAANLKNVKYSNYCDISLHTDERTGRLIIVSTIDNMVKGAAGQAIQNMNLLFGLEEGTGLNLIPPAF